jgi:hypothetical protein
VPRRSESDTLAEGWEERDEEEEEEEGGDTEAEMEEEEEEDIPPETSSSEDDEAERIGDYVRIIMDPRTGRSPMYTGQIGKIIGVRDGFFYNVRFYSHLRQRVESEYPTHDVEFINPDFPKSLPIGTKVMLFVDSLNRIGTVVSTWRGFSEDRFYQEGYGVQFEGTLTNYMRHDVVAIADQDVPTSPGSSTI